MKTIPYISEVPAAIVLFAVVNNSGKSSGDAPGKEEKTPLEPLSEKDEVKNAEENTRDAQKKVDDKKTGQERSASSSPSSGT